MEEALADRADDSLTHLALKLTDFITYVMKQAFPLFLADCEPIQDTLLDIQDTLLQRFGDMYNHSELQLHKKIWDVVIHDRQGVPKEHSFVDWCKRIALHRTESTATNSAATEHDDRFKKLVAATEHDDPFKKLVRDIFANELTAEQKKNRKYKLREGTSITTKQRSFVNAILRTNLGDARVAFYIFEHGIPTVLDAPLQRQPLQKAAIETMLEELMIWHACLLQWLVERQGAHLAELRDTNRKRFHDMSATEQRVLQDFDGGKLEKQCNDLRVLKPNHWRSKTR